MDDLDFLINKPSRRKPGTVITTMATTIINLYRWRNHAKAYDRARAAQLARLGIIKL